MLDAKHLLWLAEIVDLGSMSRAAKKLNVTQPTLTRAVQVIEDHVGGAVLHREPHGVKPTQIGEQLVNAGRKILANRLHAEDVVDLWKLGLERELRIGVGPMLAMSIMGNFFAGFVNSPPRFAVRVVSATASRLIERLNLNELDVVLAPEQINLYQDDLIQDRVMMDELAIFAGKHHPLVTKSRPITLDQLADSPWISVGTLSGIFGSNKEVLTHLGMRTVSSTISFTGDINMAIDILVETNALCILPSRLADHAQSMKNIRRLNVQANFPKRNITFWTRRKDRDRPDIVAFRKALIDYIDQTIGSDQR